MSMVAAGSYVSVLGKPRQIQRLACWYGDIAQSESSTAGFAFGSGCCVSESTASGTTVKFCYWGRKSDGVSNASAKERQA